MDTTQTEFLKCPACGTLLVHVSNVLVTTSLVARQSDVKAAWDEWDKRYPLRGGVRRIFGTRAPTPVRCSSCFKVHITTDDTTDWCGSCVWNKR